MNTDLAKLLTIAEQAVDLAHGIVTTHRPANVRNKTDRDTVTDVDLRIERELRAFLARKTPEIGFLGEEEGRHESTQQDAFWVLDPIDGTSNFVHGVPLSAVSLALVVDGVSHVGVIDTPFLASRYTATKDGGSYVNGARMQASSTERMSEAIVSVGNYSVEPGLRPRTRANCGSRSCWPSESSGYQCSAQRRSTSRGSSKGYVS
ncbi:inositol monophosphatase family protein [Labedaea rhizosphaerae]|uniref:inositol monophosphatase family protein n=1 Tax=Labedaea rhizosphaerae TaxID=598644 RepID=UPI0014151718|nr:inositol monophosphatase family protein [Labedaea rhizosphaerae]